MQGRGNDPVPSKITPARPTPNNLIFHLNQSGVPYIDPTPDYVLISASESNGYTNLQFERETTTEEVDDPHDVQYRVRNTAISRKVDGKRHATIPKGIVGGLSSPFIGEI